MMNMKQHALSFILPHSAFCIAFRGVAHPGRTRLSEDCGAQGGAGPSRPGQFFRGGVAQTA
jgi:hypothetical protein